MSRFLDNLFKPVMMNKMLNETRYAYSVPGRQVSTKATSSTTPRRSASPKRPDWLLILMVALLLLTLFIIWQTDLGAFLY